jgi:hypothetical protein
MNNGGAPLPRRNRRGWVIAGVVLACWVLAWIATGSAAAATIILVSVAMFGVVVVVGFRVLGLTDRPLFQRLASRRPAPRPAPASNVDTYGYITPEDAPTRAYLPGAQQAAAQAAPAAQAAQAPAAGQQVNSRTRMDLGPKRTVMDGMATVMEQVRPAVPELRLVTGSKIASTTRSGARAGRGPVDLQLPDLPTISRVHATFTFGGGRWWVTSEGANGLCVNGVPVAGKHPLSDGDEIRWGKRDDALKSTVKIG